MQTSLNILCFTIGNNHNTYDKDYYEIIHRTK